jgi:hypothetical protein
MILEKAKAVDHGVHGEHGVKMEDCRFIGIHPPGAFRTGPRSLFLRALRVLRGFELRFLG